MPIIAAAAAPLAGAAGKAVGKWLGSYDVAKDARRQETARTLYAAAMNGDAVSAAQLRCFGSVPLKPGDAEMLSAKDGHPVSYYSKCGFASPPAKALAKRLALQLDIERPSASGYNAGNGAMLGTSPMRVKADGGAVNVGTAEAIANESSLAPILLLVAAVGVGAYLLKE